MSNNLNEKYNILKYNEKCYEIEDNYLKSYISYSTIISIEELSNTNLQNNGIYDVLLEDYTNTLINKSKKYIIVNWDYNIKLPSIMSHYTVEPGVHRFLFDGKKFIKIDVNLGDAKPEDVLSGLKFNSNHGVGLVGTMVPIGGIVNNNFIKELDDNERDAYLKNIYNKNFYNLEYNNNRFMNDIVYDYDNSGFVTNEDVVVVTSEPDNINSSNNFMYIYGFNSDITEVKFKNKITLTDGKSYRAINKSYIRMPGIELLYEYYLITNSRDFIFLNKYGNIFAIINHTASNHPTISDNDNIGVVAAGEDIILMQFNKEKIYKYKINIMNIIKNNLSTIENKSEYVPISNSDGTDVIKLIYSATSSDFQSLKSNDSFERSHVRGVLNDVNNSSLMGRSTPIINLNKPNIVALSKIYGGGNIIYNNANMSSYQLINNGDNLELYLYKFITRSIGDGDTYRVDVDVSIIRDKILIKGYMNDHNIRIDHNDKVFKINFSYNKNVLVIVAHDKIYIDYDLSDLDRFNLSKYDIFSDKGRITDAISRNTNIYIICNNIVRYVPILYNNKLISYRW